MFTFRAYSGWMLRLRENQQLQVDIVMENQLSNMSARQLFTHCSSRERDGRHPNCHLLGAHHEKGKDMPMPENSKQPAQRHILMPSALARIQRTRDQTSRNHEKCSLANFSDKAKAILQRYHETWNALCYLLKPLPRTSTRYHYRYHYTCVYPSDSATMFVFPTIALAQSNHTWLKYLFSLTLFQAQLRNTIYQSRTLPSGGRWKRLEFWMGDRPDKVSNSNSMFIGCEFAVLTQACQNTRKLVLSACIAITTFSCSISRPSTICHARNQPRHYTIPPGTVHGVPVAYLLDTQISSKGAVGKERLLSCLGYLVSCA